MLIDVNRPRTSLFSVAITGWRPILRKRPRVRAGCPESSGPAQRAGNLYVARAKTGRAVANKGRKIEKVKCLRPRLAGFAPQGPPFIAATGLDRPAGDRLSFSVVIKRSQ